MEFKYITTLFENNQKTQKQETLNFKPDNGEENGLINLYPNMTYQKLEGFGGAMTDSAAYIYSLLDDTQKETMLKSYFGSDELAYCNVRIPIDSCDFSIEHFEAVSDKDDTEFQSFSLERADKYIMPLLEDAQKLYGDKLNIMLSPWSPPAFMKTNGERNNGGSLKEEYKEAYAEYVCKYIKVYLDRGLRIKRLSIQNEPKAVQTWDSCVYTAAQEKEFLRDYLYPAMKRHGLTDIEIFIWDHNKERAFERACEIIDEDTKDMVKGLAFHWYSGDHFEALAMIREKFPHLKLILSEACIEYSKFSQSDYLKNAQRYAHDMIGNLNNGMCAFYDWNLILDEVGGPNHVGNFCDAPYLFDTEKKELIERNTLSYIWHFSHFIKKDAVRIGMSRFAEQLEVCAFKNPDDSIAVVVLNRTDEEMSANVRLGEEMVTIKVFPNSILSGIIK